MRNVTNFSRGGDLIAFLCKLNNLAVVNGDKRVLIEGIHSFLVTVNCIKYIGKLLIHFREIF